MTRRPSRWPSTLERQLAARLRRRVRVIRAVVLEQLHAMPRVDAASVGIPTLAARSDGWIGDQVRALASRIKAALGITLPITPESLAPTARGVDAFMTASVVRELEAQMPGAELSPIVAAGSSATREAVWLWTREAALRISELEAGMVDRSVEAAAAAVDAGEDPAKAARATLDTAEDRAALLARDATGDLVAVVTRVRSQQLGSRQFRWLSRRDERVRSLHVHLDGQVFDWDTGHETEGLPGQPPNCRCWAGPLAQGPWRSKP